MAALTRVDLDILKFYVETENRELYFNYLAQKEGNDGYGTLALGVVRNDNAPGATANSFAEAQSVRDGVPLSERGWQRVGVNLIEQDLKLREKHFDNQRPDLALNLPVKDVQRAHDETFQQSRLHNDAWTPRKLLEAARRHGGEPEAEKVWTMMLDNTALGIKRGVLTTDSLARTYNDTELNASSYFDDMLKARAAQGSTASNVDPDRNRIAGRDYTLSEAGTWTVRTQIEGRVWRDMPVTDPPLLERLNEGREVRLERQQQRTQFHPDDPNQHRPIMKSPFLLSDAGPSLDPREPSHPRHALHQQCVAGVQLLDARFNKSWDTHSECMAASLTTLAVSNQLDRVDHVVLSQKGTQVAAGEIVFVVQGELNDPAHRRAHMPTAQAVTTPVEQSFEKLAELDQARGQSHAHAQQQTQNQEMEARAAMTMRG
jgi:hypothetical protein